MTKKNERSEKQKASYRKKRERDRDCRQAKTRIEIEKKR